MLNTAPRSIPSFNQILPIIGNPHPRRLAKYLGVSERTIYQWKKTDKAPKAVCLALFWESSYGQKTIDCALFNSMQAHKLLSESLKRNIGNLEARVRYLEKNGSFDSANEPFLTPVPNPVSAFS
ncbi:MAG: hypothetical protein RR100_02955 [Comamonas sp.]